MEKHYLVEFDFFDPSIKDLIRFQERQDKVVNEFKKTNRIISLSVSQEEAIMWVVIKAESESELVFVLDSLNFPDFSDYEYYELNMHVTINSYESYSMN